MASIVVGDRVYPCVGTLGLGRGATCDVLLPWTGGAGYIARLHAQVITGVDGNVTFRDLSDDGSFINDEWMCGRTVSLTDGDRIRIGVYEIVFTA